jgi:hypothetical protein
MQGARTRVDHTVPNGRTGGEKSTVDTARIRGSTVDQGGPVGNPAWPPDDHSVTFFPESSRAALPSHVAPALPDQAGTCHGSDTCRGSHGDLRRGSVRQKTAAAARFGSSSGEPRRRAANRPHQQIRKIRTDRSLRFGARVGPDRPRFRRPPRKGEPTWGPGLAPAEAGGSAPTGHNEKSPVCAFRKQGSSAKLVGDTGIEPVTSSV